jgi:hypothetical protein
MTDAPKRIWAWVWDLPYPSRGQGKPEWSSKMFPEEQDVSHYILATPEALSEAPEVQALIAEAVERVEEARK